MYIAYIRGAKFVSANTLPQINFMKQTLVTLLTINSSLSYQHSFLYIRQLAIHLRNAITIQKKVIIFLILSGKANYLILVLINKIICDLGNISKRLQLAVYKFFKIMGRFDVCQSTVFGASTIAVSINSG